MNRRTLLWIAAALLGIAATATVAWSASRLAATRIGLAGDPLSVTSGLAPKSTSPSAPTHARARAADPVSARRAESHRPARHPPPQRAATSSASSAPGPLRATPTAPVTRAVIVAPSVTSAPPATTTTKVASSTPPAAPQHQSAWHRDDSRGDGGGSTTHGRDD